MVEQKRALRRRLLRKLRAQSKATRRVKSLKVERKLRRSSLYRRAKSILCYVAHDGEVETRPILEQILADGKRLAVPFTVPEKRRLIGAEIKDPALDLEPGPYGIPHPKRIYGRRVAYRQLDLVIVPGVAFDREGRRLGRGGGYFDRFLEKVPKRVPRIGLAFRFQVVKTLPAETHDQPVTRVITD